jgi:hypothetical protein
MRRIRDWFISLCVAAFILFGFAQVGHVIERIATCSQ